MRPDGPSRPKLVSPQIQEMLLRAVEGAEKAASKGLSTRHRVLAVLIEGDFAGLLYP